MKQSIAAILMLASALAHGQQTHPCSAHAIKQAKALLIFHQGANVNLGVDDSVKVLPPVRNPANNKQFLDVLEVQGHIYRTTYRLRLIYKPGPGSCALMGQEILESSSQ